MDSLDSLRNRLGGLDEEIVRLITERQKLVSAIGKVKAEAGLPLRDFRQEKVVYERAAETAIRFGLPPEVAEKLTALLIEASLTAQEKHQVTHQARGGGRRVLVIGGAGKMGRWMVRYLASQDFQVEVADPAGAVDDFPHRARWDEGPIDHDIIVVAAPLRATAAVLQELAASPPDGLVFDIGSLKTPLRRPLLDLAAAGARVTSIHPMFGPDTDLLSGRHVIFVDIGNPKATAEARELFEPTMAVQVEMDLESHDRYIAYVLGLSHALNIAFFTALAESGEGSSRLAELSSTTFDTQLALATGVAAENPHLYFEIQSLNDYGMDSLNALVEAGERLRDVVAAGDEAAFVELMQHGHAYLETRKATR